MASNSSPPPATKLPDALEDEIEAALKQRDSSLLPQGADVGRIVHDSKARRRYTEHLLSQATGSLAGMKLAVDCAHGAACEFAQSSSRSSARR